jgi:hypothetical protein
MVTHIDLDAIETVIHQAGGDKIVEGVPAYELLSVAERRRLLQIAWEMEHGRRFPHDVKESA